MRVGVLKLRVGVLKSRVGVLKLRVGVLKSRVGVLKLRVGVLKLRVGVLKSRVGVLKLRVGVLKSRGRSSEIARRSSEIATGSLAITTGVSFLPTTYVYRLLPTAYCFSRFRAKSPIFETPCGLTSSQCIRPRIRTWQNSQAYQRGIVFIPNHNFPRWSRIQFHVYPTHVVMN